MGDIVEEFAESVKEVQRYNAEHYPFSKRVELSGTHAGLLLGWITLLQNIKAGVLELADQWEERAENTEGRVDFDLGVLDGFAMAAKDIRQVMNEARTTPQEPA